MKQSITYGEKIVEVKKYDGSGTFWCNAHNQRADFLIGDRHICGAMFWGQNAGMCEVVDLSGIAEIE